MIEKVITNMYEEFGVRPIVLGVHKDNIGAEKFYYKHGFVKTNYMDDDYYFIRWTLVIKREKNIKTYIIK